MQNFIGEIKREKVEGKIITAKEIVEYLNINIDQHYCDEIITDVVVYNLKKNDFCLLGSNELTSDDIVVSSDFYTEDDVYFEEETQAIINYCGLFDFTVIDGKVYKIID